MRTGKVLILMAHYRRILFLVLLIGISSVTFDPLMELLIGDAEFSAQLDLVILIAALVPAYLLYLFVDYLAWRAAGNPSVLGLQEELKKKNEKQQALREDLKSWQRATKAKTAEAYMSSDVVKSLRATEIENKRLKEALDEKEKQFHDLSARHKAEIDINVKEQLKLSESCKTLGRELKTLNELHMTKCAEESALQAKLSESNIATSLLEEEIKALKEAEFGLQSQLKILLFSSEHKVHELEAEISTLKERIKQLNQELRDLKFNLTQVDLEADLCRADLEKQTAAYEELLQERKEFQSRIEALHRENEALADVSVSCHEEIIQLRDDFQSHVSELETLIKSLKLQVEIFEARENRLQEIFDEDHGEFFAFLSDVDQSQKSIGKLLRNLEKYAAPNQKLAPSQIKDLARACRKIESSDITMRAGLILDQIAGVFTEPSQTH